MLWGALGFFTAVFTGINGLPREDETGLRSLPLWIKDATAVGYLLAAIGILWLKRWGRKLVVWLVGFLIGVIVLDACAYVLEGYFGYAGFTMMFFTLLLTWYGFLLWAFTRPGVQAQFRY